MKPKAEQRRFDPLCTELNNPEIGLRLKAVRRKAKLRQPEFAERLGLAPRAYSNYERGERAIPARAIKALYDEFQVDPVWLLSGPEFARGFRMPIRPKLLTELIIKVEQHEARRQHPLPPVHKARVIVALSPYCHARGKVRDEDIERALSSASSKAEERVGSGLQKP